MKTPSKTKSGFIGVFQDEQGRYHAKRGGNGRLGTIGVFNTALEAAEAYDAWYIRKAKECGVDEPRTNKGMGLL